MIARIMITLPIIQRVQEDPQCQDKRTHKLAALQNAISLPANFKNRIDTSNRYQDAIFWAIKLQAEKLIRTFKGWFDYRLLEEWAIDQFVPDKEQSTIKAKCRSVWHWYDNLNFEIPKGRSFDMSRQEAGRTSAAKNAAKAKAKVLGAIEALKFLQEKITIASVARQAGVSRDTAKKYLKEIQG